ncbi:hypothetical protein V6N13_126470 [Hibiscus sabdariffa]|uniref:RNA ligase/cyclic nucleotide phosphodiesterase family protein n=1 Tax=Hibiscus sabdariffa TaxID=183260 RepID=A0ABR2RFY7_9ROSI
MSQGFSIELYFDPALENQVLKAWNVLARRQISTQLIEIESRPHITLFSSPFLDPARLESVVKSFVSKQEPLALSFSSIGTFPNEKNLLFLAPAPTMTLLQFQAQLCEAIKKEGIEIGEEFKADVWIPYCAVAQEVPKTRMAEAFCVLRELKLPVSGGGVRSKRVINDNVPAIQLVGDYNKIPGSTFLVYKEDYILGDMGVRCWNSNFDLLNVTF